MKVFSSREFSEINRLLSSAIEREVGLGPALDILVSSAARASGRDSLRGVADALRDGASLPDALDRFPDAFPGPYRALVRAGFEGGRLPEVLRAAESEYALRADLSGRMRRLGVYLGTGFALSVLVLVSSLVLWGRMDAMYEEYLGENSWWWSDRMDPRILAFGVLLGLGIALSVFWIVGLILMRWLSRTRLGYIIPVWGWVLKSRDLALFCTALSLKLRAGASVGAAVETSRQTLVNRYARDVLRKTRLRIAEGEPFSSALFYHRFFPRTLAWAVSLGEERGDLPSSLEALSRIYAGQLRRNFEVLFLVMTPLGMLVVGNVVFLAAAAVISPMMDLFLFGW